MHQTIVFIVCLILNLTIMQANAEEGEPLPGEVYILTELPKEKTPAEETYGLVRCGGFFFSGKTTLNENVVVYKGSTKSLYKVVGGGSVKILNAINLVSTVELMVDDSALVPTMTLSAKPGKRILIRLNTAERQKSDCFS